ncbi:50S ribosomal protein L11 methyltransferase [Phyllobacterium sp. OV277]|uniref:class I SAM-dependent methyltransferase n=1 Tax=Phyllobacterium sp. OV277 TaxID=1882772 RepID=UPI00087E51A8|nr:50S ribosomal protein L11 methyltransferase [Phyllobacterium sp. OV277]SDN75183.1 Predicted nicotinamide N-methyase [Phyllobacterium sp. OV277]
MPVAEVPSLPEILLHTSHPASGLWRLAESIDGGDPEPPYWAYLWAGGAALARYILEQPQSVQGLKVLDLGAGSGIIAIAAAKSGASHVLAAEIDQNAIVALQLNAAVNNVALTLIGDDLTSGSPPPVDLVLVGDLFYGPELASRVIAFLDRCLDAGINVLIGDPERAHLPVDRLELIAEYFVPDVGQVKTSPVKSSVFRLRPR